MRENMETLRKSVSQSRFFNNDKAKSEKECKRLILEKLTKSPRLGSLSYSQFYTKYSNLLELTQNLRPGEIIQNQKPIYNGYTPLILAVSRNLEILVFALLNSPELSAEDINVAGMHGVTALHSAARKGNIPVIKQLITKGASCISLTDDQSSVLHFAAMSGNSEVVKLIYAHCEKKMQFMPTLEHQLTPLHLSCKQGDADSIQFFLKQMKTNEIKQLINDLMNKNNSLLFLAIESGSIAAVKLIFPYYKDISFDKPAAKSLLLAAASSGNSAAYALIKDKIPSAKTVNEKTKFRRDVLLAAAKSNQPNKMVDHLFLTAEVRQADMNNLADHDLNANAIHALSRYASLGFLAQAHNRKVYPISIEKPKAEPEKPDDGENPKLLVDNHEGGEAIELKMIVKTTTLQESKVELPEGHVTAQFSI